MLEDIEKIAWFYVHEYARYCVSDTIKIAGKHGDILKLEDYDDDLYMYEGHDWKSMYGCNYISCLHIWQVNQTTGFFIFADYWKFTGFGDEVIFMHRPYLHQLLKNIKIANTTVYTTVSIKGFKCTIFGYGGLEDLKWRLLQTDRLLCKYYSPLSVIIKI